MPASAWNAGKRGRRATGVVRAGGLGLMRSHRMRAVAPRGAPRQWGAPDASISDIAIAVASARARRRVLLAGAMLAGVVLLTPTAARVAASKVVQEVPGSPAIPGPTVWVLLPRVVVVAAAAARAAAPAAAALQAVQAEHRAVPMDRTAPLAVSARAAVAAAADSTATAAAQRPSPTPRRLPAAPAATARPATAAPAAVVAAEADTAPSSRARAQAAIRAPSPAA